MKAHKLIALLTVICFFSFPSFSQTGEVYLIRHTGYVGSAINIRVYIDDSLACKLKNKKYSVHTLPVGKHTVSAQQMGLGSHKKSDPFEIEVKEGQATYVDIAAANRVYCQEITPNSATAVMKKVKQTADCTKD